MPNPIKHSQLIQKGNPAKEAIKGIELLEQTLKDANASINKSAQGTSDSLKKINVTTKKGRQETTKAATETKKLTAQRKENLRMTSELTKLKAQLNTVDGIQNKGIIKKRVELQKANQEIKRNVLLSRNQKGSYDSLTASLGKNIAKWKAMTTAERNNSAAGKNLTATIKQQDAALKKLDTQIGRSQRNVGNYSSAFMGLGSAMGATMGAAGVFMVLKNAAKIIAGFEKEMAKVKAISGATEKQFKQLEDQAKALGGTTLFTATQVAELEVAYSKLGFSVDEILNATAATLDLATATDSDLASAAEVAGSTLRGFGLDAKEMKRVVDIMAKGFTTSALDIENFRESMKLIAPIANAAGVSLEVTTNLLGKLADAGLKGSIGATGLKDILLELSNENSKLSNHLGFSVKNTDDLQKAFNQLNSESLTLADAQKLIGRRGQAALLILANNKDVANLLTDAYAGVDDAARKMASIMESTLDAKITFLGSAWEGLIHSLDRAGSGFGTFVKTAIDSITGLLNYLAGADVDGAFAKSFGGYLKWITGIEALEIIAIKTGLKKKNVIIEGDKKEEIILTEEQAAAKLKVQEKNSADLEKMIEEENARLKQLYGDEFTSFNDLIHKKEGAKLKFLFGVAADVDEEIAKMKEATAELDNEEAKKLAIKQAAAEVAAEAAKAIAAESAKKTHEYFTDGIEKDLLDIDKKADALRADGLNAVAIAKWVAKEKAKAIADITDFDGEEELDFVPYEAEYLANKEKNDKIEKEEKELTDFLDSEREQRSKGLLDQLEADEKAEKKRIEDTIQSLRTLTQMSYDMAVNSNNAFTAVVSGIGNALTQFAEIELTEFANETQKTIALVSAALQTIGVVGDALFAQRSEQIQAELDQNEEAKQYELGLVEGNAEKTQAVNKKFADKEKKLKIEKAKNDKKAALFQAIINTALGITMALTQLPPYSYILAAITAAAGAVQIAAIASNPLPKFEKGGHGVIGGERHSKGGTKVKGVGEIEKGEYFGVIKRDKAKKYQDHLPGIFNSLNDGTFDDIWAKTNDNINVSVNDEFGSKMYGELRNKETQQNGKRIIKRGNKTLVLR